MTDQDGLTPPDGNPGVVFGFVGDDKARAYNSIARAHDPVAKPGKHHRRHRPKHHQPRRHRSRRHVVHRARDPF